MSQNQSETGRALQVVRLTQKIWDRILEQHESNAELFGSYNLPDPNRVIYSGAVVTDSGKLIAVGAVPLLAEAVMVVDPNTSTRDRGVAIKLLLEEFQIGMLKLDGLHAFVQDPEFAEILQKHYGFKKVKGEVLYREN